MVWYGAGAGLVWSGGFGLVLVLVVVVSCGLVVLVSCGLVLVWCGLVVLVLVLVCSDHNAGLVVLLIMW